MCLTQHFSTFFVQGLANGFLYALIALGYTLVYGVLQLINFAHSEVFMLGGFGGMFLLNHIVHGQPHGVMSVLILIAGLIGGGLAGALTAFVLERVAYRPLRRRHAPKLAYLISAIGASFFLLTMAGKEFGRNSWAIKRPYANGNVFSIFGAQVQTDYLVIAGASLAMMVLLDRVVAKTRLGQGIRAVAQDPDTAGLMGVNIDRVIAVTFILGGLLGGAAGFLFGLQNGGSVSYTMGTVPGIKAFTAAVLGGIGNVRGAVLGGLLLGVVESLSISCINTNWTDVISFIVLVLVLLVLPTGLLGERVGRSA
ncbi:MAG TPA: branched-chain amino acid ABC transporter permease [Mycobacteriales bacterium]|nr:branched-chain amino acid ABC transporter permease [Mycobacteriales bacterium]